MFEYVTDKKLLKSTYSQSANVVNQLSQRLRNDGLDARMNLVGSGLRKLVTRNGKAAHHDRHDTVCIFKRKKDR